jgi:hypothetical protein
VLLPDTQGEGIRLRRGEAAIGIGSGCAEAGSLVIRIMTPEHLHAALLRVYPTSFRREFGDHMLEVFRQWIAMTAAVASGSGCSSWPLLAAPESYGKGRQHA